MHIMKIVNQYFRSVQGFLPLMQRWRRRFILFIALIFPGVPQLFKKGLFFKGGILSFFGIGALISLAISFYISPHLVWKTFDVLYAITMPNILELFPQYIASPGAPDQLLPLGPEGGEPVAIQPFYWEMLYGCILLYVICAGISFWSEWKSRTTQQSHK